MAKTAVYAGSFDPLTRGHIDVIKRVAPLFDKLHIVVAPNSTKSALFSLEERMGLLRAALKGQVEEDLFEVDSFSGLTVEYCRKKGSQVLIRGLRALSDFEKEFQMSTMNRHLNDEVETLHIMTDEKYLFVSSSLVKEIAAHNGALDHLVPDVVAKALREKLGGKTE